MKGYAVSGITAGLTAGLYDNWTGTQTGASNTGAVSNNSGVLANSGKVAVEGGLSTWGGIGQFAANQALQNVTSATLNKALGQDGDLGDALTSTLANTFAAAGFNWVGDFSQELKLTEGGLAKVSLHAIMGGLAAEAAGGDFKSGALVAGANEALIDTLAKQYDNMTHEQRSGLLTMNSQVLGVLVASMAGGDEKDMQTGAWVAGNATSYNHDLHRENAESFAQAVLDACATQPQRCAVDPDSVTYDDLMQTLEVMAAHGEGFNDLNPHAVALVNQYYNNDLYRDRLEADLFQLTESEQSRLQTEQVAELVMAGAGLGAAAVKGGPGIVSWVKGLLGKNPEAIKFDGKFYSAGGIKIEKTYYDRLWEQGRPAPFLQVKEVLASSPKIVPDPRGMPGYYRYEGAGLEMIYNPVTGQVGHIQPLRR